jgi:hypothetical protein
MEIERPLNNLNDILPNQAFAKSDVMKLKKSRAEYQNEKYVNLHIATPLLQPVKTKIDIPPLDAFPSPAIPVNAESIFGLETGSRYVS